MEIRAAVPADAEGISAVRRTVYSHAVTSPAAVRYELETPVAAQQALKLVATVGDEVVGWGATGLTTWSSESGLAWLTLYVDPGHRSQRIGGELLERLQDHARAAGAVRARTFVTPEALGFARRHGYDGDRLMHFAGVDPRVLPEQPPTPAGLRLVGLDEVTARQAYAADSVAALDEPGDAPLDAIDFDEWHAEIWATPALDKAVSVAALAGDEIAAFAAIETDGDRAWSAMTGTVPAYRGRGLAKLVKSAALRRVAAAGVTGAFTSNDDRNGPMLAVNNWLGYRRVQTQTGMSRAL